jgi:hypothetical protein
VKLRKNLGAKIAAIAASLGALAVAWGLVHQNPPAPAAADTAGTGAAAPAASPTPAPRKANTAPVQAAPRRHVRTHVS